MAVHFGDVYSPDDFDFQNCDTGGMPEPGIYYAKLVNVESKDDGEHTPSENLSFQVLGGTVTGQQGKRLTERLYLSGRDDDKTKKAIHRIMGFAKRMGIYTEADAKALKPIEFEKAIGKEFILDVQADSYQDKMTGETKESVRLAYMGIWRSDHPDAPQCPKPGKPGSPPKNTPPAATASGNGKSEPAKSPAKGSTAGKPKPAAQSAASVNDI